MNTIEYFKKILAGWENDTLSFLPKIVLAIGVLILFFILGRIARTIILRFYSRVIKIHPDVAKIISAVIYFFFLLSGVFIALQVLGLEKVLTQLLAGAGILGIIAGFAFKDIASNAFAGLLLNIQRPFKKGDWVQVDGNYGIVLNINWLTTSIENMPGQEVFVPNDVIYSGTFMNFTTFGKRRVIFKSGVSYGSDPEHVKNVVLDEVKQIEPLLKQETVDFYYTGMSNSTLSFEIRFWIKFETEDDFEQAMSETIVRIKKRFEKEKIPVA